MAAAQLYGIAEDCAILYEMNKLYRQQSEREIGDLPVLIVILIVGDSWGIYNDFNSRTCWLCSV